MGDFSIELCGGTHVKNTAEIGTFKIVSENGIAAGVRRIEALTGQGVLHYYADVEKNLNEVAAVLKTNPAECADRAAHLLAEIKSLHSEIESLKTKMAQNSLGNAGADAEEINGVKVLCTAVEGADMNGLRTLSDELRAKYGESFIVLASSADGKVSLVAAATDGAVKKGAHAGNLIKTVAQIVGGGGGGRPNMAQAGGKDASKIGEAIAKAKEVAAEQLG